MSPIAGGRGWWWWTGPAQLVEVRVATAQETTVTAEDTAVLNASGYVAARRRATVSSKVTGKLIEVAIEEGMANAGSPDTAIIMRGGSNAELNSALALDAKRIIADAPGIRRGAAGTISESEIWCDAAVLQPAYRRGSTFQSVMARLDSEDSPR